jgi:beta-ketoacyl-acyl-carrier-protein synthase II
MEYTRNGRPRVVITGMSAITALGHLRETWEGLKAGRSGISRIEHSFEYPPDFDAQIAGEIKNFDPDAYNINRKESRRIARSSQMSIAATHLLIEDAGFTPEQLEAETERMGVVMGTSMGGHDMAQQLTREWKERGLKRPSPFGLVASLPNMPAHYVSRETGAVGPITAISVACATGTHAIGEAADYIRHGRADVVFTGGVEAMLTDYTIAGFASMRVLATEYNDRPELASRPFDKDRSGFVCSEGICLMSVESLEHAVERGAHIYAEVLGHASSSDAFHYAAPDEEGKGAARAMQWAIDDAGIDKTQIDYVNAHGPSTPVNGIVETKAIKSVFGDHAYKLAVSSTKSMLGHLLGAAGAIEAAACVFSLQEQVLHPTVNYTTPDPDCDLDYVPNEARETKVDYILKNSFGLGGQNACLVLGRFTE